MGKRTSKNSIRKRRTATKASSSRKKAGAKKTAAKKAGKQVAKPAARKSTKDKAKSGKRARSSQAKTAKRTVTRRARGAAATAQPRAAPTPEPVAASPPARKRSSGLGRKDLAQFRELLLAKRGELIGDMTAMQDEALNRSRQDATGDLSNMPIHMADLGTDNYEQEFTLGLIEGERALLREIDEALQRIEKGTYGICQATGQPITKARLRARPWAKFCYEYVLAQERNQRGSGS